jgi:hypothetical protein
VLTVTKEMICSIEQFKGKLESSKRIKRRMTPIKVQEQIDEDFKHTNPNNISQSTKISQFDHV